MDIRSDKPRSGSMRKTVWTLGVLRLASISKTFSRLLRASVVAKLMAVDVEDRYQTMQEVCDSVRQLIA